MYLVILTGFLLAYVTICLRIIYVLYQILTTNHPRLITPDSSLRTVVCIGSGGHTTEMLRIVDKLNTEKYKPRLYIGADNDLNSDAKIHNLENENRTGLDYSVYKIPRSRNVNQSYLSSVFTTLNAIVRTVPVMYHFKPQVVLCNGPGTCVPIVLIAFFLRVLFMSDCRVVFIESVCRVRSLSLTGKILQCFADVFVVQWPELTKASFRAKYFGRLT